MYVQSGNNNTKLKFLTNFYLLPAEAYLGPYQTSKMEHFAKIVKSKKAINYLCKKFQHKCLTSAKMHMCPESFCSFSKLL